MSRKAMIMIYREKKSEWAREGKQDGGKDRAADNI